ncbi:hypothetical protein DFH27DRAFT_579771 [Peziza echinospora]|nr:hypothetical protein DFH27DRAFT_579771 [Peziza echinospora]
MLSYAVRKHPTSTSPETPGNAALPRILQLMASLLNRFARFFTGEHCHCKRLQAGALLCCRTLVASLGSIMRSIDISLDPSLIDEGLLEADYCLWREGDDGEFRAFGGQNGGLSAFLGAMRDIEIVSWNEYHDECPEPPIYVFKLSSEPQRTIRSQLVLREIRNLDTASEESLLDDDHFIKPINLLPHKKDSIDPPSALATPAEKGLQCRCNPDWIGDVGNLEYPDPIAYMDDFFIKDPLDY